MDSSTTTNIVCITQYISDTLDKQGQVSKAFHRLDHRILINRLDQYGVSKDIVSLLNFYLSNRIQYVQYHGYKSGNINVLSGVPRGSILGPLLFNILLNDITSCLNIDFLMYADDIKLFTKVDSYDDCARLQNALELVNDCSITNNVPLNIKKRDVI